MARFKIDPYTPCVTCERPLRPAGTTIEQYPGTLKHRGRGACSTCYDAMDISEPPPWFMRLGDKCKHCHRPMRPRNTKKSDYPGTVRGGGHGLCASCNHARILEESALKPGDITGDLPRCKDCDRPMRPYMSHAKDWPGTRTRNSGEQCKKCYHVECARKRRAPKPKPAPKPAPAPPPPPMPVKAREEPLPDNLPPHLARYMAGRHKRLERTTK